jgi:hypothetical protein
MAKLEPNAAARKQMDDMTNTLRSFRDDLDDCNEFHDNIAVPLLRVRERLADTVGLMQTAMYEFDLLVSRPVKEG